MLKGLPIPTDEEANAIELLQPAILSQTAMIKFPSDFRLPSLSVFDFKRNYWVNLAQSAIPKELESQIHVISATKNSQSSTLLAQSRAPIQRANAEDHLEPLHSCHHRSSGKPKKSSYKIINSCRRQTEG